MTRKHFNAIAASLALEYRAAATFEEKKAVTNVALRLATEFRNFNPRFDSERFMNAVIS